MRNALARDLMQTRDFPWMVPAAYMAPAVSDQRLRARDENGPKFDWDFYAETLTFPSLAPGVSAMVSFQVQKNAIFECSEINGLFLNGGGLIYLASTAAPLFSVQIVDGSSPRNLFSQSAPLNCIVGTGRFPHTLPIPRRFPSETTVNVIVTNLDSAITAQPIVAMIGRKTFVAKDQQPPTRYRTWRGADEKYYAEDYFAYVFNFGTVSTAAGVRVTAVVEDDADFEWVLTTGGAYTAVTTGAWGPFTAATAGPELEFMVTDTGIDRHLNNAPVLMASAVGAGTQPFILPETHVFRAQSNISILMTTPPAAVTYNSVYLLLEGRKIFEVASNA